MEWLVLTYAQKVEPMPRFSLHDLVHSFSGLATITVFALIQNLTLIFASAIVGGIVGFAGGSTILAFWFWYAGVSVADSFSDEGLMGTIAVNGIVWGGSLGLSLLGCLVTIWTMNTGAVRDRGSHASPIEDAMVILIAFVVAGIASCSAGIACLIAFVLTTGVQIASLLVYSSALAISLLCGWAAIEMRTRNPRPPNTREGIS